MQSLEFTPDDVRAFFDDLINLLIIDMTKKKNELQILKEILVYQRQDYELIVLTSIETCKDIVRKFAGDRLVDGYFVAANANTELGTKEAMILATKSPSFRLVFGDEIVDKAVLTIFGSN